MKFYDSVLNVLPAYYGFPAPDEEQQRNVKGEKESFPRKRILNGFLVPQTYAVVYPITNTPKEECLVAAEAKEETNMMENTKNISRNP